jgi:hypothetical protein
MVTLTMRAQTAAAAFSTLRGLVEVHAGCLGTMPYHQWSQPSYTPFFLFPRFLSSALKTPPLAHHLDRLDCAPFKAKQHYNSFSPRIGLFIPLADMLHP